MRARLLVTALAVCVTALAACDKPKDTGGGEAKQNAESPDPSASATPPSGYDWIAYDSDEGRFSIQFPRPPVRSTLAVPSAVGTLNFDNYMVELPTTTFGVSVVEYPAELVANGDINGMLDGARDGAVANVNGRLLSERAITVDGHPARRLRVLGVEQGIELYIDTVHIVVDNRLFQALVTSLDGGDAESIEWFLTSFHPRGLLQK